MSLSDLPDDILNLISIQLNGFDNCSLWMASDSKLRQRLVNNVITDFDIKYTIPGRYLWPGKFLKKLSKLSRLSLVVDPLLERIPIENIEPFPISTLKCLELDFTNLLQMFQNTDFNSSNHSTGPITSSSNKFIDLNDYFGNLEHLKICTPLFEGTFPIDFLRFLPHNLKTLSMPQNHFILNDHQNPTSDLNTHIEILPRTLTSLEIRFEFFSDHLPTLDFSRLPPNLTSLTTNLPLDEKSYDKIPKTLKELYVASDYNIEKLETFLPAGLESLSFYIDKYPPSCQTLKRFQNLQSLNLQSQQELKIDDFIINCPPKLQEFVCTRLVLTDLVVPSKIFSNCLTRLVLNLAAGISPQFISALPPTLTELNMSHNHPSDQPFPFFGLLPKKLKSLVTNFHIIEDSSLLPESLTYLRFTRFKSDLNFDRLPPKLETFTAQMNLSHSVIKVLPQSLHVLYITSSRAVDDEMIRMLPRGLKDLTLKAPDEISDAAASDLPPQLESLILLNNMKWTDDAIPLLPRSLTRLNLPLNPNFTDKCIKHLPPQLVILYLNDATKITSNSCKDLPRYLKILSLPKCMDWDSKILLASKNSLPQYIISVRLGNEQARKTWQKILGSVVERSLFS